MALKTFKCSLFPAIPNTAFFFSAISTHEKKTGSIDGDSELEEIEGEHEPSPIPSTSVFSDAPLIFLKSINLERASISM